MKIHLQKTSLLVFLLVNLSYPQWSNDPNNNLIVGYGQDPKICSDSAGGCYITYEYGTTGYPRKLAVERLDRYGYKPWGDKKQILGELEQQWMAEIVEDGEGGVIISYSDETVVYPVDFTYRVRVQRVDSAGNFLWGTTGVRVSLSETNQGGQKIISDGDGGCIVVWGDTLAQIRINRINSVGERLWGDSGKVIEANPIGYTIHLSKMSQNHFSFCYSRILVGFNINGEISYRDSLPYRILNITSDESGGVVASWFGGSSSNIKIISQRKDSLGNNLWQEPYVEIADSLYYLNPKLSIKQNNDYFYYGWTGKRNGIDKVTQFQVLRLDGSKLFPNGSIQVGVPPLNGMIVQPLAENRTAFVYYSSDFLPDTLLVQAYDTLGNKLWTENGVVIAHPPIEYQSYTTDGNGGFIIGGVINNFTVVAQQVSRYGNLGEVIPIPVELISFTGVADKDKVILSWVTATELNNYGFEVEKQVLSSEYGAGRWEGIGFVEGHGTTTEPKIYSFIDRNVETGIYKYQLKQIDFDGTFTYSNEIEVEVDFIPKEFVLYQNYPNPFNPVSLIKWQQPLQSHVLLKVYDILGNEIAVLVNEEKSAGNHSIEFDASGFASGVYFYTISAGGVNRIMKMVMVQ